MASRARSRLMHMGSQPFSQPQCPHLSTGGADERATMGPRWNLRSTIWNLGGRC